MKLPSIHLLTALTAYLAPPALAQEILWQLEGKVDVVLLGRQAVPLGDLDQDGYVDLLDGAAIWLGTQSQGQFWVISGRDGTPLRARAHTEWFYHAIRLIDAGDVNGDGMGDYAVMFTHSNGVLPNKVEFRSGRDESLLGVVTGQFTDGFAAAILGNIDIDGDRKPDLIAAAPDTLIGPWRGSLFVFRNDRTLAYRLDSGPNMAFLAQGKFQNVGKLGDVDGDGCDDYVTRGGIPAQNLWGALLISGRTGTLIRCIPEPGGSPLFGDAFDGCGDVDRDGVPDFVTGIDPFPPFRQGYVTLFSTRTGQVLHHWHERTYGAGFGPWSLRCSGIDVDLDGVPDVIVGSPFHGQSGSVTVFSGRDGSMLYQHARPFTNQHKLGMHVAVVGPQPGSRFPCFLSTDPEYDPQTTPGLSWRGQLTMYRGSPAGVRTYGLPGRGRLAGEPRIGLRDLGGGVRITVHGADPGQPAVLLIGSSRTQAGGLALPFPLDALGLPGCSLLASAEWPLPVRLGAGGIQAGWAAIDLPGAITTGPGSFTAYAQWLCLGAGNLGGVSDAVQWSFR